MRTRVLGQQTLFPLPPLQFVDRPDKVQGMTMEYLFGIMTTFILDTGVMVRGVATECIFGRAAG